MYIIPTLQYVIRVLMYIIELLGIKQYVGYNYMVLRGCYTQ